MSRAEKTYVAEVITDGTLKNLRLFAEGAAGKA